MNATNGNERSVLETALTKAQKELDPLEKELIVLREEIEELKQRDRFHEPLPGSRYAELLDTLPEKRSRVAGLRERLEFLDKIDTYHLAVSQSATKAKVAREKALIAEGRHNDLAEKIARLGSRIEKLRAENLNAETQAAGLEVDAAQRYANAISNGDAKAEKVAQTEMRKAQEMASAIRSGGGGQ